MKLYKSMEHTAVIVIETLFCPTNMNIFAFRADIM